MSQFCLEPAPWPGFQGAWRGSGPHAPGAEGWLPRVERASPSSVVRLGLVPAPPPLAHGHMAGAARKGSTVPGLALQASPLGSGWSCARRGAQRSRCPAAITGSEGQWAPVRALSPAWRHGGSLLACDGQCLCFDTGLHPVGPISAWEEKLSVWGGLTLFLPEPRCLFPS